MQPIILANFLLWVDQITYLMDGNRYFIVDNSLTCNTDLAQLYCNRLDEVKTL